MARAHSYAVGIAVRAETAGPLHQQRDIVMKFVRRHEIVPALQLARNNATKTNVLLLATTLHVGIEQHMILHHVTYPNTARPGDV